MAQVEDSGTATTSRVKLSPSRLEAAPPGPCVDAGRHAEKLHKVVLSKVMVSDRGLPEA